MRSLLSLLRSILNHPIPSASSHKTGAPEPTQRRCLSQDILHSLNIFLHSIIPSRQTHPHTSCLLPQHLSPIAGGGSGVGASRCLQQWCWRGRYVTALMGPDKEPLGCCLRNSVVNFHCDVSGQRAGRSNRKGAGEAGKIELTGASVSVPRTFGKQTV